MAQVASANSVKVTNNNNNQKALCPFYGSSHGCPYLDKCSLSHTNPNSIELCPSYQLSQGCSNPDSCYYRHSLLPLSRKELNKLQTKHKIPGKIQYSRIIKGNSVHRVIIIINQVLWYGIHFIIEDNRLQKIHHQRYCAIYYWNDAILVSELIGTIILKSKCPGKYLSYLKNLIDGDTEPGKDKKNKNKKLVHYRDILSSIGNNFKEIPKPINPHLVKNLSRVPWVDFKLLPLPFEVYEHPEIFLKPGDLVRIWRPKKFVYHCGVYLGNERVIHISNGYKGDDGLSWRNSFSLFQSGSAGGNKGYYDYGKKMKEDKQEQMKLDDDEVVAEKEELEKEEMVEGSEGSYDKINAPDVAVYDDDDDMDLVDDDSDDEQQQEEEEEELKQDEYVEETQFNNLYGEKEEEEKKSELLYQDMDEIKEPMVTDEKQQEYARRARECTWKQFLLGSRKKDLELGFFVFPWRTPEEIVYTAKFLTEIHYMKGQYSVLKNNCEHFSLYCCTGLRYSPQANTIENVLSAVSKIGSFAGNIFSKATSFRNKNKDKKPKEDEEEKGEQAKANENRKNHPVLQDQELDDGGDDELEKILLNDNNNNNDIKHKDILVMDDKKPKKEDENKERGDEFDISIDINGNDNGKKSSVFIDEYANDEEDVLAQSIILEQNEDINNNLEHLSRMNSLENMTPGGLTMSEILSAKKHYNQQRREKQQNQQKWDV